MFGNKFKELIEECLDNNSYFARNLKILSDLYPEIKFEFCKLPAKEDQEQFYSFLITYQNINLNLSIDDLLQHFYGIKQLLKDISLIDYYKNRDLIEAYLKLDEVSEINSIKELKSIIHEEEIRHQQFLINEYNIVNLKQFLSNLFLRMDYKRFEILIKQNYKKIEFEYPLLHEFYRAKFPIELKNKLYFDFMRDKELNTYIKRLRLEFNELEQIELQKSTTILDRNQEVRIFNGESFTFFTMNIHDYQEQCLNKHEEAVIAIVRSDKNFQYSNEGGILGFLDTEIMSYQKDGIGLINGKNLRPSCIIAFDQIRSLDLTLKKHFQIPIILIDTETYAKLAIANLYCLFEKKDWQEYIKQKNSLYNSLINHPWLLNRYFVGERLYEDVRIFSEYVEEWSTQKISTDFLKEQLDILKMLIENNMRIDKNVSKKGNSCDIIASKYQKIMVKYQQLI